MPRWGHLHIWIICLLFLTPAETAASDTLRITFIGDVMQHREQLVSAHRPGRDTISPDSYDYSSYFKYTEDRLGSADFAVANMEFPCGIPPYRGYPAFSAPASLATATRDAGVDLFLCANNHICDRGAAGIRSTLDLYDSLGVLNTGIYRDSADFLDRYPLVVNIKGPHGSMFRVAFVNFTYGTNGIRVPSPFVPAVMDTAAVRRAMVRARSRGAEFIIVLPHWGNEYQLTPSEEQRRWQRFLFGCGADAIIGGHPHVMQPVEMSPEGVTMFSLGNFISNMRAANTQAGSMFTILLTRTPEGDIVVPGVENVIVWCPRNCGPLPGWTALPIEDFYGHPELFSSAAEYEKMTRTFKNIYGDQQ